MNVEWGAIIVALIAAIGSALTVVIQARSSKPKTEASTADSIAEAAKKVVEMQNNQMATMEAKISKLECEVLGLRRYTKLLRSGVNKLVKQIEKHGLEPEWTPDELPVVEDIIAELYENKQN